MEHITIDTAATLPALATFTADAAELFRAVDFLSRRVIERRNQAPILSYVRMVADVAGTLTVTGSNLDQAATITIAADVAAPGEFCLDASALADALKKASKGNPGALASICDGGEGRAALTVGRGRFNMPTLPADDFPIRIGDGAPALSAFTMSGDRFLADLAALAPAMSTEETKYYLRGIAVQLRELAGADRLVMAATDGHTMALASRPIPAGAEALDDAILPRYAVAVLLAAGKMMAKNSWLKAEFGAQTARFKLANITIETKLVDGTFPDWSRPWETALAPTDEPALFPELLPGAPVSAMEKLSKAAGGIAWEMAQGGMIGTLPGDDGLLFGACRIENAGSAKPGFSYVATGATGEVIAEDGRSYPIGFSGTAIHLSAAQLRALIGESCFETMTIEIAGRAVYILQWLWDQGDSRFLTVRPDGRCFGPKDAAKGEYFTRAEIEAALAGETAPHIEPLSALEDVAPVMVAAEPETPVLAPEIEPSAPIAADPTPTDGVGEILARLAALEERVATLATGSADTPTVAERRRTPAHERAVRRAWAERRQARLQRAIAADHMRMREQVAAAANGRERHLQAQLASKHTNMEKWAAEARKGRKERGRRTATAERARRMIAASRQATLAQAQCADVAQAQLAKLRTDMADPSQPERASDITRLLRERDEARTALSAVTARAERSEAAVQMVATKLEEMASRVAIAEAALRTRAA